MKKQLSNKLRHFFVRTSLVPIARFCLRQSIKIQDIQQVMKEVLVTEAVTALQREGVESSASKIALITGVHRKDVTAILSEQLPDSLHADLITKVLGQWQVDKDFSHAGRPKPLTCVGKESQFVNLVRKVNKEINPYTVLFELERSRLVSKIDSTVVAEVKEFVPVGNAQHLFSMYKDDGSDLLAAIEENAVSTDQKHFHLRTAFDNIPLNHLEEIRKWIFSEGEKFHKRVRDKLARYDRDTSRVKSDEPRTVKVAVTLFEYSSEVKEKVLKKER